MILGGLRSYNMNLFQKWRFLHENEARMRFSRSVLVSNCQTDIILNNV